ncbi:MAG: hypothetical protein KC503_14115 [Myxococcales bacterium]|nr:hypothetical protein [Myxococcales bacterium]
MLAALAEAGAEHVVVGAYAMAAHGVPRATGDIDILVRPSAENAARVFAALCSFGAPLAAHGLSAEDFAVAGTVYQIGVPPSRIDVLTRISGVSFDEAWTSRVAVTVGELRVPFIGRDALIANKRASGRDKDLIDLRVLEEQG